MKKIQMVNGDLLRPRGVDRGPPRKISDVILRGEYTDNLQGIPHPLSPYGLH